MPKVKFKVELSIDDEVHEHCIEREYSALDLINIGVPVHFEKLISKVESHIQQYELEKECQLLGIRKKLEGSLYALHYETLSKAPNR